MGQKVSKIQEKKADARRTLRDAVAAWWALPPPGRVDEHNREAASLAPDVFQGFRGEFNRYLETLPTTAAERRAAAAGRLDLDAAPRLLVSHQTTLARPPISAGAPGAFALAPGAPRTPPRDAEDQVLTAQYTRGALALLGRVGGAARSVFASAAWAGARARATVQAELPRDARRPAAYGAEAVWCVGPATTSVRARSTDRVLAVAHMQALTARVAAGAQWLRACDGTALQAALRAVLRGGNAVVAALATLRPRALALSYTQRITAHVRATAALDVQPVLAPPAPGTAGDGNGDEAEAAAWTSCATVGCEYATADGDRVVRAQVDTHGDCALALDEALDDAVRLAVSAQVNPFRHTYVWGVGLSCTS